MDKNKLSKTKIPQGVLDFLIRSASSMPDSEEKRKEISVLNSLLGSDTAQRLQQSINENNKRQLEALHMFGGSDAESQLQNALSAAMMNPKMNPSLIERNKILEKFNGNDKEKELLMLLRRNRNR